MNVVPLYLGFWASYYLDGFIDEVRVSSVNRSAGWVKTCYVNQYNPSVFYNVGVEELAVYPDNPVQ